MNSIKIIEDIEKDSRPLISKPLADDEESDMEPEMPGGALIVLKSDVDSLKSAGTMIEKGVGTLCVTEGAVPAAVIMRELRNAYPYVYLISEENSESVSDLRDARSCGADAVIVSPSIMDKTALERVVSNAGKEGLKVLFRFRDASDIARTRHLRPDIAILDDRPRRDLPSDLINPISLRELIDWECRCFFMSSSGSVYDFALADREGFAGIMTPLYDEETKKYFYGTNLNRRGLWTRLAARRRYTRPFIKIGGLRKAQDANLASNLGADILGFDPASFEGSSLYDTLAAVVSSGAAKVVSADARNSSSLKIAEKLLKEGLADGIEFSGKIDRCQCMELACSNYYRAVRIHGYSTLPAPDSFSGPRTLLALENASSSECSQTVYDYIDNVSARIWISGSLNCDNIGAVIKKFKPELVEVSEGIETPDGYKDPALMRRFFKESLYSK